jgi:hypothetical protein
VLRVLDMVTDSEVGSKASCEAVASIGGTLQPLSATSINQCNGLAFGKINSNLSRPKDTAAKLTRTVTMSGLA